MTQSSRHGQTAAVPDEESRVHGARSFKSTAPADSETLGSMSNPPMLSADVARTLGVSVSRVHELDDRLQPERTPSGVRIYRYDSVLAEIDRRCERTKP